MLQYTGQGAALRKAYQVSLAVMVLLLLGSIVWYRQRMIFLDPSWISFDILNRETLSIQEHRYGSFVSQMWVLGGGLLHLPISVILLLYSASFYIFYMAVMLILGRIRQYALGILLACYFTLIVSDVYFWPNNEVHQGIGWMMLFLGGFFHYQSRGAAVWWMQPLIAISLFMALFSHFIVLVPLSFLILYYLLYNPQYWNTRPKVIQLLCYSVLFGVLFLIKLKLGKMGGYDSQKLEPVLKANPREVLQSFKSDCAKTMLRDVWDNYWLLIPIFLSGMLALLRLRQWLRMALTLAYAAGFFALICLTYKGGYGRPLLFYMESEWMAWSIILVTPFVLHVLPELRPSMALAAVAVIFLVRLAYIGNAARFFDARYQAVAAITEKLHRSGTPKAILTATRQESDSLFLMDWGAPYESVMLSAMKGYRPQVSYRIADTGFKVPAHSARVLIGPWSEHDARDLNPRYFSVDTAMPYRVMPLHSVLPGRD